MALSNKARTGKRKLSAGDFPLSSPESRAAARMLATNRWDTRKRGENVYYILKDLPSSWRGDRPPTWKGVPCAGSWEEDKHGVHRSLYIPVHWERSGFAGEAPVCTDCGTPYRRIEGWRDSGWIGFVADCLRRHVPDTPLDLSNCKGGPFMADTPTYYVFSIGALPPGAFL